VWDLGWWSTYVPSRSIVVFAGPSLRGIAPSVWVDVERDPELELLPPARRGDIAKLAIDRSPSTIALVDGTFYSYPSVGHAEIRSAIEGGWTIWGLSSMGAIRAAEMAVCGMKGYGAVYRCFIDDADFDDDEVALLHGAEAPYHPISEPMIHLRRFVAHLVDIGSLSRGDAAASLRSLKQRWFGDRTLGLVRALVRSRTADPHSFDALLADFDAFRTKSHDLASFLAEKPWRERIS
jgi:hypothetical protein